MQVVNDNLQTDYGNESYSALDNDTVHMPMKGLIPSLANSSGDPGRVKKEKGGFRGLVRCV